MSFHCSLLICIISVEKSANAFKTESGAGGGRLLVWLMYVRLKRWSFVNSEIFFITLFIPFISDVSQKEDDRRRKTFCWLYVFRTVRFHSNDPSVAIIPIIFNFSFGYVSLISYTRTIIRLPCLVNIDREHTIFPSRWILTFTWNLIPGAFYFKRK